MDLDELQSMLDKLNGLYDRLEGLYEDVSPYIQWASDNWVALALTCEIGGGVMAVIFHRYRLGFGWLLAAIGTIWLGGTP